MADSSRDRTKKRLKIAHCLALKGKNAEQLRDLANRYLAIDPSAASSSALTEKLSFAATQDESLSRESEKP